MIIIRGQFNNDILYKVEGGLCVNMVLESVKVYVKFDLVIKYRFLDYLEKNNFKG